MTVAGAVMARVYRLEIANRVRLGRVVGTDYVVTCNGMIVQRFAWRLDAERFIEGVK